MKTAKYKKELLTICNNIIEEIRREIKPQIKKDLAMIAVMRIQTAIKDELTNAESFLNK